LFRGWDTAHICTPSLHDALPIFDHPGRDEHRLAASEFAVVDLAAPHELVLEQPRVRRLGILLDVARHDRVASSAHRDVERGAGPDRKSTRLNSSHVKISYAVFCL